MNKKKQWLLAAVLIFAGLVFLALSASIKVEIGYTSSRRMAVSGYPAVLGTILLALGVYGIYKLKKGEELLFWTAVWDLIVKNDEKALHKAMGVEDTEEEKRREDIEV